ncbi:hypothetical protein D9M69_596490 [compost metagenome]
MCFSQGEAGWQTQRPATLETCAGRQCSQGVGREGALTASSRRDQQTEQSQLSACGRRRYWLRLFIGHRLRLGLFLCAIPLPLVVVGHDWTGILGDGKGLAAVLIGIHSQLFQAKSFIRGDDAHIPQRIYKAPVAAPIQT